MVFDGVVIDEALPVAAVLTVDERRTVLVEQERLGDQRTHERTETVAEVHRLPANTHRSQIRVCEIT